MNMLMFPFHDYKKWISEGFRTRDAHLFEHLETYADVKKILIVNRPTSIAEVILKRKSWRCKEGEVVYCSKGIQLLQISDKVWCIDFLIYDFLKVALQRKKWWYTAFGYKKVLDAINEALVYLDMCDNILLLQNPMAINAVENVKHTHFVFDAIDNWLYHPQMKDKHLIQENYRYVDKNADLILTVSEELKTLFSSNKNVNWVPNGVDVDFFAKAISDRPQLHKFVVGYVGKIQDRVDFELIEKCLREMPECEFCFVGPIYSQKAKIAELSNSYDNIRFLGDVHYDQLPGVMKCFDVAIIPHKVDAFTNSMNPLKLYEYLAAGKIVVTTGVAGTNNISPFVYTAEADEFTMKIKQALSVKQSGLKSCEVVGSIPKDCLWTSRVEKIMELISAL